MAKFPYPPPSEDKLLARPPLARRLTLARHAAGLTQAVASRAVGVSQVHLCDVERGMSRPSEALVRRLLDLYGIEDLA